MKLSSMFAVSMLLGVFVASFGFISPVNADAEVILLEELTTGWYQDIEPYGCYHVEGVVLNELDASVGSVMVAATFHNPYGYEEALTMLPVISPGQRSPFVIAFWHEDASDDTYYEVAVADFSTTAHLPVGLEILSESSYVDEYGMHIVGEIQNIATGPTTPSKVAAAGTATGVKVIATFYDATGKVVAAIMDYSIPSMLDPGENASFHLVLGYANRVALVDSYALTAQSEEYALIPEFPIWTSILLILTVLAVSIAIYKRRLLKTPLKQ